MFFIDNEEIPVFKNDLMKGLIVVKKNEENVRDLDIKI